MTRRGHRSLASIQRTYISRLISQESHRDLQLAESINTLTPKQIEETLMDKYGVVATPYHLRHIRGEVLSNARGTGSLQIFDEEPDEE